MLHGFESSEFEQLSMYSEVLQDSAIELLDQGKLQFASASSITVSKPVYDKILANIEHYRERIVLRPQGDQQRARDRAPAGIIAINTALEFDIYGNVNSTHVGGTHMMNGIGGSGDFARNAHLAIFVSKSMARTATFPAWCPWCRTWTIPSTTSTCWSPSAAWPTCAACRASAPAPSSATACIRRTARPCRTTSTGL